MLVFNEMISDARVIKEAKTLSENNYKVTILSFKNNDQNFFERKLKFLIIHIKFIFRKKPNVFLRIGFNFLEGMYIDSFPFLLRR